jgi:hypothetical protein
MRSALSSGIAVGLLWILALGTAHAIIVRGHVDPPFGANTGGIDANLGWSADLAFDVDPGCLIDGTHLCAVTGVTLTGSLYDATPPPPDVPLETNFNFLENSFAIPSQFLLTISGGLVTAIGTGPLGYHVASNPLFAGNLWVDFVNDPEEGSIAQLLAILCPPSEPSLRVSSFSFFSDYCDPVAQECSTDPNQAARSQPASVTITQETPEPGSLLLLAGALLAIGFMRRQQRAR